MKNTTLPFIVKDNYKVYIIVTIMKKIVLLFIFFICTGASTNLLTVEETANLHLYFQTKVNFTRHALYIYADPKSECTVPCVKHPSQSLGVLSRDMNKYLSFLNHEKSQLYVTEEKSNPENHIQLMFVYQNKERYCRVTNPTCSIDSILVLLQCFTTFFS